jgi:hypothetical protein
MIDYSKYQSIEGLKVSDHEEVITVQNRFGDIIVQLDFTFASEGILTDVWHGFVTPEEYKIVMEGMLIDAFVVSRCSMKICNTQNLKIGMNSETSEWFKSKFLPKLITSGLKYNAIVMPKDMYARESMEYFERNLTNHYAMLFSSFDIALLWMRSLKATSAVK